MTAPVRPGDDLIGLRDLFLDMRQQNSAGARRELAFQVVLHSASTIRLEAACGTVVRYQVDEANLSADVLQEARLFLCDWLTDESLNYIDMGVDRFGSWYWILCRC